MNIPKGHLWQKAAAYASRAHEHHFRKDRQTPYFSHPVRVAMTVACVFGVTDPAILAAALLHDTIEDSRTDYDDVLKHFGKPIADIVTALSKDKRIIESKREAAYDAQLAAAPWQAKLIKLADVYDNFHDCTTGRWRESQAQKMRRAVKIAGSDPRLAKAVREVKALISPAVRTRKK
jgi:guanosine-3',5'-bis(diphosphate) 3'-pyrophosphohydrolase